MKDQLQDYYRQIEKSLNCPKRMRTRFLGEAKDMVADFLREHPGVSFEEVKRYVGNPDELAATFMESVQPEVYEQYVRKKRYIKKGGLIALIAVVICSLLFSIIVINIKQKAVITKESTIIIYEKEENQR